MDKRIMNRRYLVIAAICEFNNKLWISSAMFNAMYTYDLDTHKSKYISNFPGEANDAWKLHARCIACNNKVYFLPDTSKFIHYYDVVKGVIKKIEVNESGRIDSFNALLHDETIYFVSLATQKKICILNTKTDKLEKKAFPEWCQSWTLSEDNVYHDKHIFWVSKTSGKILKYSIDQNEFTEISVLSNRGFGSIAHDGTYFWLSDEHAIYRYNSNTRELISIKFPSDICMTVLFNNQVMTCEGFKLWNYEYEKPVAWSCFKDGNIYLFPCRINMIVKVDVNKLKAEEYYIDEENEDEFSLKMIERSTYQHYIRGWSNKYLLYVSTATKKTYLSDIDSNDDKNILIWADDPVKLNEYITGCSVYIEGIDGSINDYICSLI